MTANNKIGQRLNSDISINKVPALHSSPLFKLYLSKHYQWENEVLQHGQKITIDMQKTEFLVVGDKPKNL